MSSHITYSSRNRIYKVSRRLINKPTFAL
uniref:Uncharacterized protein n=1 Tax=Anguilla anguilla TaxID=7936 RepID=A0A0E9QYU7_ANGAN